MRADSLKHKPHKTKAETASHIAHYDSIMFTSLVDVHERRDAAASNFPRACLNSVMDEFVLLKMADEQVDVLMKTEPSYGDHVSCKKGNKLPCLMLNEPLCGCVQSALSLYELFSSTLVSLDFELNPYDSCVANENVNGSQCTICWHVDNNKMSHAGPSTASDITKKLESKFGKITVARGKKHEFLDLVLTFHDNGNAEIDMKEHTKSAIQDFGCR